VTLKQVQGVVVNFLTHSGYLKNSIEHRFSISKKFILDLPAGRQVIFLKEKLELTFLFDPSLNIPVA